MAKQLEHCGYQGLNLTCTNQNRALNICNTLYNIKSINYSDNSFIVSYPNQIIKEQSCPKLSNNVTVPILFNYTYSNKILNFFYNCTLHPPSRDDVKCLQFGAMRSFVFTASVTPEFDWRAYCESIVTAPVLDDGEPVQVSSLDRVLTEGFKPTRRAPAAGACQACEASNSDGFCGYSTNGTGSQEFFCICPDGGHSISGYGEGALTLGGGLIVGATFYYRINKKNSRFL